MLIEAQAISKSFGDALVLDEVSLAVDRRERIVVCGPSGSGKSTLIRCFAGLESVSGGTLSVCGEALHGRVDPARALSGKVGMVFQDFNLFPHLTVLDNCTIAQRRVLRRSRTESREAALEQLRRLGMEAHAQKFPGQLSGGQKQRAAIARSLCMNPEILLFDEPTSALDPEMVGEVLQAMMELASAGVTMVCVTHEIGFARRVADRVVFMDHGRVVETGTPDALFLDPQTPRLRQFLAQVHGGLAGTLAA
ncbi:amino acid ABC transporter ATP-binding protein [Aureimonas sp. ME7]|uniref:amino acid ABC transporter ATP-binding protein n=1 Tax=Aureimonas sp. ME7 TaxID=2744252 RepID=UPI0015F3ABBC|nr:amino acid ABC transporter ATP-binding protein [Aureimonas sp. ME7]